MKPEITAIERAREKNMSFLHNEEKHQNLRNETNFLSIFWIRAKSLSLLWLDFGVNTKQQTETAGTRTPKHSPPNSS